LRVFDFRNKFNMNYFYFIGCILLVSASLSQANPSKRYSGFGVASVSTISSSLGCVVTGPKLFINGIYTRDLNDTELQEVSTYKTNLDTFKENVKAYVEAQRKKMPSDRYTLFGFSNDEDNSVPTSTQAPSAASATAATLPDPPKKPSFCSDNDTTQYIFDGCKIQGNKVYIGNTFARNLTSSEVQQLQNFDAQWTQYQAYVQSTIQKQVESLFGQKLSNMFMGSKVGPSSDTMSNSIDGGSSTTTTPSTPTTTMAKVDTPVAPNFCTVVYWSNCKKETHELCFNKIFLWLSWKIAQFDKS